MRSHAQDIYNLPGDRSVVSDGTSLERRHIFIDYSNVSIGFKSNSGKKSNFKFIFLSKLFSFLSFLSGLNVPQLASLLKKEQSRALNGALIVVGSESSSHKTSSTSAVWRQWELAGFKGHFFFRE